MEQKQISERSRRVAVNTVALYIRMLVLMFVGLFTSRIVLGALGIDDYGTYGAVGGVVMLFTLFSNSIAQAISRFLTFDLGRGGSRLKEIFSASVWVQLGLSAILVVLVNTLGLWFLKTRMDIPAGRMDAAVWVLEFSLVTLVASLMAVPYNATIIAHEKMGAFAWISLAEGALKLAVALLLSLSPVDKLKSYAVLMAVVALLVRLMYVAYCRRHFPESRASRSLPRRETVVEMVGFAGWNFFGSSAFVVNTQGVNLLVNVFFGVGVNAARNIATQVEGIVKQFVTNFLTALNPQITKSWAEGDRKWCFDLVCRGSRLSFLILLFFAVPVFYECELLLDLWLPQVPQDAALFVRLVILAIMADMVFNPLVTLEQAYGKIRNFYLITGGIYYTVLPVSWVLLRFCGAPSWTPYAVFIAAYLVSDLAKMAILRRQVDFPVGRLVLDVLLRGGAVALMSLALTGLVWHFMPQGVLRLLSVLAVSTLAIVAGAWMFALTEGEKDFVKSHMPWNRG